MMQHLMLIRFLVLFGLAVNVQAVEKTQEANQGTQEKATSAETQSLSAQGWYDLMIEQAPKAMYQGIFIHQSGVHTQSVEISHGMKDGQIWERMLHLDGPAREIIRRGQQLYCIHPDARVERLNQQGASPFNPNHLGNSTQLQQGYNLALLGYQRIAGRPVVGIRLVPKDEFRHEYHLWLDRQTLVPLKSELVGEQHQILERYQFSFFAPISEWTAKQFEPRTKGVELALDAPPAAPWQGENLGWKLNWVPIGFAQRQLEHAPANHVGSQNAERRMFTDGIVMFSVYVEPVAAKMDEGTAQIGPTVLAVQHKQWQGKTHRITVVGEIPRNAAQRIAQSVELM